MDPVFQVDPALDVPIYQQLVDKIRSAVRMGTLVPGQQLPTVQEMSRQLSIARGTIKRAYDELEHLGVLEKIQGRGTFICYQPANSTSRKEQAMAAIDTVLDQLEDMGFSSTEIGIFLSLKQREREEDLSTVKVAVVDSSPEIVSQISEQLRGMKGVDLYSYLLNTIQAYPYKLDEDVDLVVTTAEHAPYLETILANRRKLLRVALRLSPNTLPRLVRLDRGAQVGVLCASSCFADMLLRSGHNYTEDVSFVKPQTFDAQLQLDEVLTDLDGVLVPIDFEKYCDEGIATKLRGYDKQGKLIRCCYEMDEGSLLYLEEKLRTLREEKTK